MIDTSPIDEIAKVVSDAVSEQLDDEETAFVRTVAVIVELDTGSRVHTLVRCSDDRDWATLAFLKHALRTMRALINAQG